MAITKEVKQLVDPQDSEKYIYPVTGTACTYDQNGLSVDDLLAMKQHVLTPGIGINITENTIRVSEVSRYTDTNAGDAEISFVVGDIIGEIYANSDLSRKDIYGNMTGSRNTANCYVIKTAGYYCFPLVYGNGIKDGAPNSAAYTSGGGTYQADFVNYKGNTIISPYIETDTVTQAATAELMISDEDNIIDSIVIRSFGDEPARFLCFNVLNVPSVGANAVIAIKDSEGNVMWSWHIWLWPQSLETVAITNNSGNIYNILPVNLASKYDADGTHIKNWFYQWGRKDPLLCPENYNSNTDHIAFGSTAYGVLPAATVSDTIKNPTMFFTEDVNHNNNWNTLDYFYNFWDASETTTGSADKATVKTVYDPSPVGFKVGNARVFNYFSTTNVIGSFDYGYYFKRNSTDTTGTFFAASGGRGRKSGGLSNVGSYGFVWSAGSGSAASAYYLYFSSGSVYPVNNNNRSNGFSVRSVSE